MSRRILIIEEVEGGTNALKIKLNESGYVVFSVADPILGIKQAQEVKPELILLDLVSPSDSGSAVIERIRLLPDIRTIPVIVLAGAGFEEAKNRILKSGTFAYIEKPFNYQQVVEEVQKALHKTQSVPKIMVVDDDPLLVRMLQGHLVANGFDVIPVTDGEEALKMIGSEEPDMVVTDIVMPNVSGWQITQEIKKNQQLKKIPIILLSALIEKEGNAERHEIGDYFMSKPVMMGKLLEKIKELLPKNQPSA